MVAKVAIFNDTAVGGHYGCMTVMEVLAGLVRGAGGEIIHCHPGGTEWLGDHAAEKAIELADIVIVNGEGTIHHATKRARRLSALGPYCADLGKRSFLINSTLQDNDAEINAEISRFDHVWVRESASAAEMRNAGIPHTICQDLSLLKTFARHPAREGPTLFVDSVVPEVLFRLIELARLESADLVVMKQHRPTGFCMGLNSAALSEATTPAMLKAPLRSCPDQDAFAALLSGFERIVTGRFHAMCFAIGLGIPFHAYGSNSHKVEAMLSDIGLDPQRLLSLADTMPAFLPFSISEQAAISNARASARSAANDMIRRIFAS